MSVFLPFGAELARTQVIEASAGTGKTYTITNLILRLLLERGLAISEILVVTYTRAATAELRDRVRSRLRTALLGLTDGRAMPADLAAYFAGRGGAAKADRARLAAALRGFDDAAIFTIHGFCQRALTDAAFESGTPFDVELLQEQRPLIRQVVWDYWALSTYQAAPLRVRTLRSQDRPEDLEMLAAIVAGQPHLPIVPAPGDAGELPEPDPAPFFAARAHAAQLFAERRTEVAAILLHSPALHRNRYNPKTIATRWLPRLAELADWHPFSLPDYVEKLTPEGLAAGVRGKQPPPVDPFFEAMGALLRAAAPFDRYRAGATPAFRASLCRYVVQELSVRKRAQGVLGFDDLLVSLDTALGGEGGGAMRELAARLRRAYPAALIDEFQDTDPLQYRIFERIYGGTDAPLFLIGDPKQAIYAFRGADVFAYLRAARRAPEPPASLTTNYRSDPGLIAGVNALFTRAQVPFVIPDIEFHPVEARPGAGARVRGDDQAPLSLLFVGSDPQTGKRLDAAGARRRIGAGVAAEVTRLLASDCRLDGRPVAPRDVAILCRTNAQAREVQAALRAVGVPSALEGDSSVFDTQMAVELSRVLLALVRPGQVRSVRAALAGRLFGVGAEALQAMEGDDGAWDGWLARFLRWHQVWHEHGFMPAFYRMMDEAGVQRRLLSGPEGQRQLTDLLHLSELLHDAALGQRLGPLALVAWLSDMRQNEENRVGMVREAAQVRLESDDHAVRLTTIHRSKGLEYPIVFCPFLWGTSALMPRDKKYLRYHDARGVLQLDVGSQQRADHQEIASREALSEHLRLMYVALTRARHRCYVVCGDLPGLGRSALAYLLHHGPAGAETSPDMVADRVKRLKAAGLRADLEALAAQEDPIAVRELLGTPVDLPRPAPEAPLVLPRVARAVPAATRMLSFSSLSAGDAHLGTGRSLATDRDRDAAGGVTPESAQLRPEAVVGSRVATAAEAEQGPPLPGLRVPLADFPAGARPGTLIHELYEHTDFVNASEAGLTAAVEERLTRFGYGPALAPVLGRAIHRSLATPLSDTDVDLRLAAVGRADRLDELEFTVPVARVDTAAADDRLLDRVAACFTRHASTEVARAYADQLADLARHDATGSARVRGFLRGFMDLVFRYRGRYYLVDYKSNHLGDEPADYAPARLHVPMAAHHYVLQYHLYVVVLDRFLRQRLPGYRYQEHFGGVYYLFVRGMDPDHPPLAGIYADRPADSLVADLASALGMPHAEGHPRGAA